MLSLVTDARMCALTAVPEGTQTWSFMGLDEISSLCVTVFRQTLSPHSQWEVCQERGDLWEVRSERTDGPLVSLAEHCMISALQIPLGSNCTEPCGGERSRRVHAQGCGKPSGCCEGAGVHTL